ncbi:OsmC family protein [Rheinheimera texasensis]|jgi:organic hydroperoxide reductase OsmC/OhrA|uniref:OsmC family protein n=1 Tax=Rheinheimera texasensis TaxID=306205 RepID=UPI0004E1D1F3|nr:OsmC family protein [Rheinheimera texasensis]
MAESAQFSVQLRLLNGYKFEVDFGDAGQLLSDEPPPLGDGEGPNPSRLLAAAVANCLAASLLFAVRKFKEDPGEVSAEVQGELERQDGRWRIGKLQVALQLGADAAAIPHLERALSQFENFCVVTQSVRQGIEVTVQVRDSAGKLLHQG